MKEKLIKILPKVIQMIIRYEVNVKQQNSEKNIIF